ncbi:hypothetical protein PR202_ga22445 [Eleusine coracana subsp. coracana]|uniref:Protein kinase domain-containing protein n=1 Tax=Eleusine coracana subsp. coracana TaxID=191504 RepID=A0AAV5D449_ELECO|nr:hypothetical protein PR202_ga22445 [Eleusine coracana subsp. coracana]
MKATRSFHKANIVGEGADGTVYRGIISTGGGTTTTVAVKRCKRIDKSRKEEFVQELVILCRVNHPNIVKLLGCCLHFEAPMLVYEFMHNGTLNDLLHGSSRRCVTLATRLRIAAEVAEALAHLHSPPHTTLHGDVKPENILMGEGWVAKVSDFGCSTIDDNVQVVPKGTLAYLDPEFLQDFQITDKTDVYSLGVVLMELLTRKKPPAKQQMNLRIIFQESMANGTLSELLDTDIIVEEGGMRVIHQAAELANRCTAFPAQQLARYNIEQHAIPLYQQRKFLEDAAASHDEPLMHWLREASHQKHAADVTPASTAAEPATGRRTSCWALRRERDMLLSSMSFQYEIMSQEFGLRGAN